jgi:hypothetical protein
MRSFEGGEWILESRYGETAESARMRDPRPSCVPTFAIVSRPISARLSGCRASSSPRFVAASSSKPARSTP